MPRPPIRTIVRAQDQHRQIPNNLPTQSTRLIGRAREVEDVWDLLAQPDVRILTLTGPGGVGKTRLGLQVAASLLSNGSQDAVQQFGDGVYFVPLAAVSDPDLVIATIAHTLELRGATQEQLLERLKGYLQDKEMLLLLDNFEQVVSAAPLLSNVLADCPGVKVMITSRELLHLYGEHDYPVPPLSLPDPDKLPGIDVLAEYEAVGLFLRCAQAVSPGFQLTERNALVVAEICNRLDGLPLAIELAAARIMVLAPEELAARLDSRLKLLRGGARNLPARQQTLQATIDWSYNLLDGGESALFRRLGAFVGGCTLAAIEDVCVSTAQGELEVDALDGVASLVGKSLLQRQEGGMEEAGETRFVMLETIREYARGKLEEAGEREPTRDQHLDYFIRFAETAEQETLGPEQVAWMRRLDAELNNVRAALEWSLSRKDRAEKGLRLAGAMRRYWQSRAYLSEGEQWCTQLLSKTDPAQPSIERALVLRTLANMIFERGDFAEARPLIQKSLEMSVQLGDDEGAGFSLRNLGSIALWHGEYDASQALVEESLAICRRNGDRRNTGTTLSLLGTILMLKGEYQAAEQALGEALDIDRAGGNAIGVASALAEQGTVALHLGDAQRAKALIEEGLALAREVGVDWIIVKCLARLGMIALHLQEPQRAEELCLEGVARFKVSGNRRWSQWYMVGLAEIARLRGLVERAARLIGVSEGVISAANAHYEPAMRAEADRIRAGIRALLDGDSFSKLWAKGQKMTLEEAVAFALEPTSEVETLVDSEVSRGVLIATEGEQTSYPDDITEREVQVLRLIAAGKSNQEIALQLTLSLRTVERHISNIYQKIGATGRVARATATAYAIRHGFTH